MTNITIFSFIDMKLYELDINGEDTEVYFNSLVSVPAHLKAALKFNADNTPIKMHFNNEKQIVTGVAIAVDEPIYRYNPQTKEEFNVVFRKGAVERIMQDYMKKGYANNLNFEHQENEIFNSAYLIESYQIDSERGMSVPEAFSGQNLQDGSWIMSYKIEDKEEWEKAKSMTGFSIEGNFELIEIKSNNENMNLLEKLGLTKKPETTEKSVEKFKAEHENFAEATLTDGTVLIYDGELAEGIEVFVDVDGVLTAAPEGTHALEDGTVIEVDANGVVTSVVPVVVEDEQKKDEEEEEEEKMSNEQIAEVMAAMKADYEEKINALRSEFTAHVQAFESFKNTPQAAPTKEKFAAKKVVKKPSNAKEDILAMVRKSIY